MMQRLSLLEIYNIHLTELAHVLSERRCPYAHTYIYTVQHIVLWEITADSNEIIEARDLKNIILLWFVAMFSLNFQILLYIFFRNCL